MPRNPAFSASVLLIVVVPTCVERVTEPEVELVHLWQDYLIKTKSQTSARDHEKLTAIGAGLPGTLTDHGWPAWKEGNPSGGTLIPGNIRSAPPRMKCETSPPLSVKAGNR